MAARKVIAVDFDGTVLEHTYPKIEGDTLAFHTLKALREKGHLLIL